VYILKKFEYDQVMTAVTSVEVHLNVKRGSVVLVTWVLGVTENGYRRHKFRADA
jgi:hypothetical protein